MNHFAILGLPVSLLLDPSEVENAWRQATCEFHPDIAPSDADVGDSAKWNQARMTLADPVLRLEHWLQCRNPDATVNRSIDPALMELFPEINAALETADSVLSRHRNASTALARALLAKEAVAAQLSVQACLQKIQPLKNAVIERFPEYEREAEEGSFDRAGRGLGQLKFLRKWEQQCQERLLFLIEC